MNSVQWNFLWTEILLQDQPSFAQTQNFRCNVLNETEENPPLQDNHPIRDHFSCQNWVVAEGSSTVEIILPFTNSTKTL